MPGVETPTSIAIPEFSNDDSLDEYLDDYQEDLRNFVDYSVDIGGKLDRYQRASQIAVDLASRYDISHDLFEDIFSTYGWGQARIAVEALLQQSISETELFLTFELRKLWAGCDEINRDRNGNLFPLSWEIAFSLVRYFGRDTDIEEIEIWLQDLYQEWTKARIYNRNGLYRYLYYRTSFYSFLREVISSPASDFGDGVRPWVDCSGWYIADDSLDDLRSEPGKATSIIELKREGISCEIWRSPANSSWPMTLEELLELEQKEAQKTQKKEKKKLPKKRKKKR